MPTYRIKAPNGKTYSIQGPEGASEEEVIAEIQRQNPQDFGGGEQPERGDEPAPEPEREVGALEAAWDGLQSSALFGFDDELSGISGAIGNKIGNFLGMNETTADFWDVYEAVRQRQNRDKDRSWEQRPGSYAAGFAPGLLLGPSFLKGRGPNGAIRARDVGRAGATGGALSGAGNTEGDLLDRAGGAAIGAGTGYVLGTASKPVLDVVANVGSRAIQRMRPSGNNLNSGLDALATRADLDPEAMAVRAAELEELGVPARLIDVMDEQGRGVVSSAANKQTGASEDLARAADDVYSDVQDRVAAQARTRISPGGASSRQIGNATEELRDSTINARMEGGIRDEPIRMTDEIIGVINKPEGVAALRQAQRTLDFDSPERAVVDDLLSAIAAVRKGAGDLPPAARAQVYEQTFGRIPMTVGLADRIAVALGERGSKAAGGTARVLFQMKDAVRGAARSQSSVYGRALDDYADASRTVEAARGEGRFADTNVLRSNPEEFADQVGNASAARPQFVDADGVATRGASTTDAVRARAADDIANAAQEGAGQGAPRIARQLARGRNQQSRNEALIGREGAEELQDAMAAEVARLDNTRYIDPRIGSDTFRRMQQDEVAGEIVDTAATAGFSPMFTMIRAVGRWLKNTGISGTDAERLVRDAIDPARTQDAIAYLIQKGVPRNNVQSLIRMIQSGMRDGQIPGRIGGEVGEGLASDEQRPANPSSVRSLSGVRRVEQ